MLFLRRAAQTLLMSGLLFLLMIWSLFAGMMLSTLAVAALTNQDNVGVDFPFLAVGYQTAAAIAIVLLIAGAILASRLFHWKRLE